MDQTYKTAVTTSTFPNMHTFLRGPEFCLMFRKVNEFNKYMKYNSKFYSIQLIIPFDDFDILSCFQLQSSCKTIKNVTLDEMYPKMCELIKKFSDLCVPRGASKEVDSNDADDDNATTNQTISYSSPEHEDYNSSKPNAHDDSAYSTEEGKGNETSLSFSFTIIMEMK